MSRRAAILMGFVLWFATRTIAQDHPKVEVPLGYSFMRFNPENSDIVSGFSLNGGGGGVTVYANRWFGITAEFEGYGSLTKTFTFPAIANSPCPAGCTVTADGNLFTYNVGPVFKHRSKHFEPFVETLFGGAHSNTYQNLLKACQANCVTTQNPSNNAWDFVIGGGFDVPVSQWLAIRPVQFDYVLTRFGNSFTKGNQNQSNFRYIGGLVLRFGGGAPPPPPNRPPVASCSASPAQVSAGSGETVVARADASDPDNDVLTYRWTTTGGTVDGTGAQVRWSFAGLAPGTYSVMVRVDDGRGGTASCAAEIRVERPANRPPTMSCSASPSMVHPGDRVHITAKASDPDDDPLTFTWQANGGRVVGSGAEVDLDTTGVGAPSGYTVTGRVDDGRGGAADCQAQFNVEPAPPPAVEARLAIRSIYFPTALPSVAKSDAGLVASQQRTLTSLVNDFKEYLTSRPNAHLVLEGHADPRGTPDYNQALSQRRVEITKRFLIGLGIPEANLETKAHGEEQNMTPEQVKQLVEQHPNLTQEQKDRILSNLKAVTLAQNRRVDITLSSTGQQSVRQFPFNAEDALTLLSPKVGGAKPAATKKP
jgi:outer membrane protein OmpA-like peptidoglycan-associated protein